MSKILGEIYLYFYKMRVVVIECGMNQTLTWILVIIMFLSIPVSCSKLEDNYKSSQQNKIIETFENAKNNPVLIEEGTGTYADFNYPLSNSQINDWHKYLKTQVPHLCEAENIEYLGFLMGVADLEYHTSAVGDTTEVIVTHSSPYNSIYAFYKGNDNGKTRYYFEQYKDVLLEDVPGSEDHYYENPSWYESNYYDVDAHSVEEIIERVEDTNLFDQWKYFEVK